jgi:hypothetical protein
MSLITNGPAIRFFVQADGVTHTIYKEKQRSIRGGYNKTRDSSVPPQPGVRHPLFPGTVLYKQYFRD